MLKNILNLDGAQQLSKNEQKEITGGLKFVPEPWCICGYTNWGTSQDPSTHNGVGMTFSTTYTSGAIPIGFVMITPPPACCNE